MPDRLAALDLPPQVARQLAQGFAGLPRDPGAAVEIALDPPELGRVRLSFVEVNGVMTLSITAERPETADLMRRHMALLSEEFARQGLDGPSVNISGGGDGGQGARDPQAFAADPRTHAEPADAPLTRAQTPDPVGPRTADAGMDLRL
jgi:flagellar hook-length control protein FliK